MNKEIENIEDISPLTIVKTKFGKIVILNAPVDAGVGDKTLDMSWVDYIQGVEEIQYQLHDWMEEHVDPCLYGIGKSLTDAFKDYKNNMLKYTIEL